ncbi:MAG: cobalamin-dependent protein, partial [Planctomycetota bacterium]
MTPPHGLQLISALTPKGHRVKIVDEYHRPASRSLRADLVGISVWTAAAPRAYALADHYRRRGIPVVLGGPHVTVRPEEAMAHADAIVIGE